jgi:hypothetical protein
MFPWFDLSALFHRRYAKFTLISLIAVTIITLVALTARAPWVKAISIVNQDSTVASPTVVTATNTYVRRAYLQPRLYDILNIYGDRLEKPGKERLILTGTLTRRGRNTDTQFRMVTEIPNRFRLEEQIGSQLRVTGFDGDNGWAIGTAFGRADQEIIETLSFDSFEHFFFGQMQGLATRFLGSRFRLDDGTASDYRGPFYDIYQVSDQVRISNNLRQQPKLFYINSDTLLLERVRYQTIASCSKVNVEIRIAGWQKVNGQQLPGSITRIENDIPILTMKITSAVMSSLTMDNIFKASRDQQCEP